MRKRLVLALVAGLGFAAPALAGSAEEAPVYDLLFKQGTLDNVSAGSTLIYTRDVTNPAKPEMAERESGQIAMALTPDATDGKTMAKLELRQDDKHRGMGSFPASVGNPMIMVFYEGVIRDMAETAGGSPFYIRNRVKDALVQPAEVSMGLAEFDGREVPVKVVTLRPFTEDPNRERMMGFGDLALTVTMSEEVPGWYLSLEATAPVEGVEGGYRSDLRFDAVNGS
jgi:hypothetical protein